MAAPIETNSTPPAWTDASEDLTLDPQTSHITVDVPLVPRLVPEPVPKAQSEMSDGLSEEKTTTPKVFSMKDQWKQVSAYPNPTASKESGLTVEEVIVEAQRPEGFRERMYQDRARDSATMGWGDDQIPLLAYARDASRILFGEPSEPVANIDVASSPSAPSQPAPPLTLNAMFEGMRNTVANLQNQFAVGMEFFAKVFENSQKTLRGQQFLTPSEGDELP